MAKTVRKKVSTLSPKEKRHFIVTSLTYKFDPKPCGQHGERNELPSMTLEDQAMSIYDLMQRHVAGTFPLSLERPYEYDDTEDFDSLDRQEFMRMEYGERNETIIEHQEHLDRMKSWQEQSPDVTSGQIKSDERETKVEPGDNKPGSEADRPKSRPGKTNLESDNVRQKDESPINK